MAALKLVESGHSVKAGMESETVVQFPKVSTFNDAWEARKGQMRTRGDGKEKTRKLWAKAEGKVGSTRLLEALRRYLREEKEPTCGYCGLSVWLNGERYDHWLRDQEARGTIQSRPVAPEPLRGQIVSALGEDWTASYLDPCTFLEDGWIIPRTETARKKLMEVGAMLKAAGIAGLRRKP